MNDNAAKNLRILLFILLLSSVIFIYLDQSSISLDIVRNVFQQHVVSMSEDEHLAYEIASIIQVNSAVYGGDVWCIVTDPPIGIRTSGGDFQPVSHFVVNKQFQSWYVLIYESGDEQRWTDDGCTDW
jgi:hypothetical protein